MPECQNCGGFVTPAFARVFGNNEDRVSECPECSTHAAIVRNVAR